jgi:hypothetical protein
MIRIRLVLSEQSGHPSSLALAMVAFPRAAAPLISQHLNIFQIPSHESRISKRNLSKKQIKLRGARSKDPKSVWGAIGT